MKMKKFYLQQRFFFIKWKYLCANNMGLCAFIKERRRGIFVNLHEERWEKNFYAKKIGISKTFTKYG